MFEDKRRTDRMEGRVMVEEATWPGEKYVYSCLSLYNEDLT